MTDDPLPDDEELQEKRDADYIQMRMECHQRHLQYHDEMLKKARAAEVEHVRLEVAKATIPQLGKPRRLLRETLDWWVDWITGELPE